MKILLSIFFFITTLVSSGQQSIDTIQVFDLKKDWKVFSAKSFVPYSSKDHSNTKIIYFEIDRGRYQKNSEIRIQGSKPFSVYLNHKLLIYNSSSVSIHMDSLQGRIAVPWLFGIYQTEGLSWMQTHVVSPIAVQANYDNAPRPYAYYRDFSILASLVLAIFLVVLLRTNPRLTFDYFNFVRLFSIQEREDTLLNSRISSSVNIPYYGFSSLVTGFVLLTIFHFGADQISVAESFIIQSTGDAFYQWIKLSLLVMMVLLVKLILLAGFAQLFYFREALSLQFFNYIRLTFFIFTVSCLVCLFYFIFKIQGPESYSFLNGGIILLLVFWVLIIGLKLLRRTSFRFFHLFSYLCASELIPVVILVKVLNS